MRTNESRSKWQALRHVNPNQVTEVPRAIETARLAHELGDMRLSSRWATRAEQLAAHLGSGNIAEVELKRAQMARTAGRIMACRHYVARALRADPDSVVLRERAAELMQAFGDLDRAAACLSGASDTSRNDSPNANLLLRQASIAAARGKTTEARENAERITTTNQSSAAVLVSVGRVFLSIADFDSAQRCFVRATEVDPQCVDAHVAMAFSTLHQGKTQSSFTYAARALKIAPNHPRSRLASAMARFFCGENPRRFLEDFDAAVDEMPSDAETLALRAQARRAAGDARGALDDLLIAKHSGNEVQNFLFDVEIVALGRQFWGFSSIEELTAMAKSAKSAKNASTHAPMYWPVARKALGYTEPLLAKAIGSLPDRALRVLADRVGDRFREEEGELAAPQTVRLRLLALLCPDELLRATSGNRSAQATYIDSITGKLTPLDLRRSARHRAKAAQWALFSSTPDAVLRSFDSIALEHPRSHHPNAYRGEVLLWLGRHDEAAADFQRGLDINPRARWLHIGMGAVRLFQGNIDAAIASFQQSVDVSPLLVGPTLLAYRGEALRILGKTSDAVRDLQIACRDNPTRISAWINLWLAQDDLGNEIERHAAMDELWARARYLLSDAAEECFSRSIFEVESAAEQRQLLEYVLRMMRGNRSSSCVTYFTRTDELRTVTI